MVLQAHYLGHALPPVLRGCVGSTFCEDPKHPAKEKGVVLTRCMEPAQSESLMGSLQDVNQTGELQGFSSAPNAELNDATTSQIKRASLPVGHTTTVSVPDTTTLPSGYTSPPKDPVAHTQEKIPFHLQMSESLPPGVQKFRSNEPATPTAVSQPHPSRWTTTTEALHQGPTMYPAGTPTRTHRDNRNSADHNALYCFMQRPPPTTAHDIYNNRTHLAVAVLNEAAAFMRDHRACNRQNMLCR